LRRFGEIVAEMYPGAEEQAPAAGDPPIYYEIEQWEPRWIGGPSWVPLSDGRRTDPRDARETAAMVAAQGRKIRLVRVTREVVDHCPAEEMAKEVSK
jgi:hypothetical protein